MIILGLLGVAVIAAALVVVVLQSKKAPTETRARAADPCEAYTKGKPVPKPGIRGTIQSMKEDSFVLRIGGGSVSKVIVVCSGATITNTSNEKLTYKNLVVGNKVTVGGNVGDSTGATILASIIIQDSQTSVLYSNLSSTLNAYAASFSFTYSGTPAQNFYVAMSTDPKMLTDVYVNFAEGPTSPISQNNPTKWNKYSCGSKLYWRMTTENLETNWSTYNPKLMSPIISSSVTCK